MVVCRGSTASWRDDNLRIGGSLDCLILDPDNPKLFYSDNPQTTREASGAPLPRESLLGSDKGLPDSPMTRTPPCLPKISMASSDTRTGYDNTGTT